MSSIKIKSNTGSRTRTPDAEGRPSRVSEDGEDRPRRQTRSRSPDNEGLGDRKDDKKKPSKKDRRRDDSEEEERRDPSPNLSAPKKKVSMMKISSAASSRRSSTGSNASFRSATSGASGRDRAREDRPDMERYEDDDARLTRYLESQMMKKKSSESQKDELSPGESTDESSRAKTSSRAGDAPSTDEEEKEAEKKEVASTKADNPLDVEVPPSGLISPKKMSEVSLVKDDIPQEPISSLKSPKSVSYQDNTTSAMTSGRAEDQGVDPDLAKKEKIFTPPMSNDTLEASLKFLKNLPSVDKLQGSGIIEDLMKSYLPITGGKQKPTAIVKPTTTGSIGEAITPYEKVDEWDKEMVRKTQKKQPPPPPRPKTRINRSWIDPRAHQRVKLVPKQWPPSSGPDDRNNYVIEGYGQTDPYSKSLIKNIQKEKRLEIEKAEAEKRAETVEENLKPVSTLRDTFTYKPPKPAPGVVKPIPNISKDREWITHDLPTMEYVSPPEEPEWMNLIRNRRWKSTVKARFPCSNADRYEFERRSTTPKNWKRLAGDKHAMKMLSEIAGIGPEGEELFQKLAQARHTIEQEQEMLDKRAEEELMAYEIAREQMGSEAAYNLQKDAPLPTARNLFSSSEASVPSTAGTAYPFTTSQLEAAFLTNQLLKLHPEEFRKIMTMERSRQATLRWQFSADKFSSIHEKQDLPYEIALMASDEPRVHQAMRKLLATANFNSNSLPRGYYKARRTRSEGGSISEMDGYESSTSVYSTVSADDRGRKNERRPPPPVKPRGRSASPSASEPSSRYHGSLKHDYEEDREIHAHGFLSDAELAMSEELVRLQEMTNKIRREVEGDLAKIEDSLETRQERFFDEVKKADTFQKEQVDPEEIDKDVISSRREDFIVKDKQSSIISDPRDEVPKVLHKVRHIGNDAQLDAVFRRRRKESDYDAGESTDKRE